MLTLTKVNSSNVSAVDYLEEDGVVLVRFRDGSLYARTGVSRVRFEALMAADSKGSFLHGMSEASVCILRAHGATVRPQQANPQPSQVLTVDDLRRVQQQNTGAAAPGSDFAIIQRR